MTTPSQKKYATVHNPYVSEILNDHCVFPTKADAVTHLELLRKKFHISKAQPPDPIFADHQLCFWVRGYQVTQEEAEAGYLGNFARLYVIHAKGKWRIRIQHVGVNLEEHPIEKRPVGENPDFGYVVIRNARRGKRYDTAEEARAELALLREVYPVVSIHPHPDELFTMAYSSEEPVPKKRMKKIRLEVVPADVTGKWRLRLTDNMQKPPTRKAMRDAMRDERHEKLRGKTREICQRLLIVEGGLEWQLVELLMSWSNHEESETWAVCLIQPGPDTPPTKRYCAPRGAPCVRLTRLTGQISAPIAYLSRSFEWDGRTLTKELVLRVGADGNWEQTFPTTLPDPEPTSEAGDTSAQLKLKDLPVGQADDEEPLAGVRPGEAPDRGVRQPTDGIPDAVAPQLDHRAVPGADHDSAGVVEPQRDGTAAEPRVKN